MLTVQDVGPQEVRQHQRSTVADPDYFYLRCRGKAQPIDGRPMAQVDVDSTMLDVEASLCYLDDLLCARGGCDIAARLNET